MTDLEQKARTLVDNFETSCTGMEPEAHPLKDELAQRIAVAMQALVAAAYAACAKTCLGNVLSEEQMNGEPNLHVGEMCLRLCHERDAAAIRKLTPADAARELERIKALSKAESVKTVRSCNRHDDCDKADEAVKAKGGFAASHCHDECCDECFGA